MAALVAPHCSRKNGLTGTSKELPVLQIAGAMLLQETSGRGELARRHRAQVPAPSRARLGSGREGVHAMRASASALKERRGDTLRSADLPPGPATWMTLICALPRWLKWVHGLLGLLESTTGRVYGSATETMVWALLKC